MGRWDGWSDSPIAESNSSLRGESNVKIICNQTRSAHQISLKSSFEFAQGRETLKEHNDERRE
jgi:hypothetical protein